MWSAGVIALGGTALARLGGSELRGGGAGGVCLGAGSDGRGVDTTTRGGAGGSDLRNERCSGSTAAPLTWLEGSGSTGPRVAGSMSERSTENASLR